jgi:hypothetical protein
MEKRTKRTLLVRVEEIVLPAHHMSEIDSLKVGSVIFPTSVLL